MSSPANKLTLDVRFEELGAHGNLRFEIGEQKSYDDRLCPVQPEKKSSLIFRFYVN